MAITELISIDNIIAGSIDPPESVQNFLQTFIPKVVLHHVHNKVTSNYL